MPKQHKTPATNLIDAVHKKLEAERNTRGKNFISEDLYRQAVSFESLDTSALNEAQEFATDAETVIQAAYAEQGATDEFDALTEAQKRAAVIALQATSNPAEYHREATARVTGGVDFGVDSNSGIDSRTTPALEAFDNRNLTDYVHFSPVYNLHASRQDDFGEMFYPTVTTTPDNAGFVIKVQRTMVHNEYQHLGNGAPAPENFMSKSLIDASTDHRVLKSDVTRIYPQFTTGSKYFSSKVGATSVQIGNLEVKTAPLAIGQRLNLISISQNPTLDPNGVNDVTDSLDNSLALENVYLAVANAAGQESIIKIRTLRMPLTEFQHAQEGFDRDMVLSFRTTDLPLYAGQKAVDGTESKALAYLKDPTRKNWTIRLAVSLTGTANVETGNVDVNATGVEIESVWETMPDGSVVQVTDDAAIAALKADLVTIKVDSYDLYARRSNLNRRQRGLLVRVEVFRERYMIPLGSPITALQSITETTTLTDIAGPIEATRKLNSNNAVTKLFEYAETLAQYKVSMDRRTPVPRVEGIGRLLVRPYYEHYELDLTKAVDNPSSHERAEDIRMVIIELIRDGMAKAANISGYLPALEAAGGGNKATVAIGTEPRIHRYLIVSGDTRLMTDAFDYVVRTTTDDRMHDKIFCTFVRSEIKDVDPLNFGNMIWIPELITDVPNSRGGAQAREFMVQPRVKHINNLPILLRIDVKGLDVVTQNRTGVKLVQ